MQKINMDNIQEATEFKRPTAGAYVCKITKVEDIDDKKYLKVSYDFAEGEFAGYYEDLREKFPNWDWCGAYAKSYKEGALPMFKRFCSAVSKSNGNFVFDAGEVNSDEQTLIDKKIGLLFQEEEYYGNDGNIKTRLNVVREFPIDDLDKQKVPAKKTLNHDDNFTSVEVASGVDEELPFN